MSPVAQEQPIATPRPTKRPARRFRYVPVRRERRLSRWHSRLVGLLKLVLPAIAIVLIGLVALWPELQDTPAPTLTPELSEDTDASRMLNPRYFGVDQKDQPFSIAAQAASQAAADADVIELAQPEAEITLDSGQALALNAESGRYDRTANHLRLSGDVILQRDDGFEAHTSTAHVDLGTRSAWGDAPITVDGPDGSVVAEGFRIVDEGATVVFTGKSRLVIRNDGGTEAAE